jgi:hypothetical protein
MSNVGKRSLEIFDLFGKVVAEELPKELDIIDDISPYLDNIEKRIYGYLKSMTSNYQFEDLSKIVDLYNTDILFTIYYNQLKQYLRNGGNTNATD